MRGNYATALGTSEYKAGRLGKCEDGPYCDEVNHHLVIIFMSEIPACLLCPVWQ